MKINKIKTANMFNLHLRTIQIFAALIIAVATPGHSFNTISMHSLSPWVIQPELDFIFTDSQVTILHLKDTIFVTHDTFHLNEIATQNWNTFKNIQRITKSCMILDDATFYISNNADSIAITESFPNCIKIDSTESATFYHILGAFLTFKEQVNISNKRKFDSLILNDRYHEYLEQKSTAKSKMDKSLAAAYLESYKDRKRAFDSTYNTKFKYLNRANISPSKTP